MKERNLKKNSFERITRGKKEKINEVLKEVDTDRELIKETRINGTLYLKRNSSYLENIGSDLSIDFQVPLFEKDTLLISNNIFSEFSESKHYFNNKIIYKKV
jgi:diphthamide synthase (EF-2-diphthine--ammonia ligase)